MITILSIIAIILMGIFVMLSALFWFLLTRHPRATRVEEETEKLLEFPPAGTGSPMTPETKRDSFIFYFEIPEITLTVGTSPESKGHVEKFSAANKLMARLDIIGKKKLVILSMAEAGVDLAEHHVNAINHYLWSCGGLRSFKRVAKMGWKTKYGWTQFRESLSVPVKAFIIHT